MLYQSGGALPQVEGGDPAPVLSPSEAHLERCDQYSCSSSGLLSTRQGAPGVDLAEADKDKKGTGASHQERLRELGLLGQEKMTERGPHQHLSTGRCQRMDRTLLGGAEQ